MIELTLLSGRTFWVNPHQIESAESKPDTTLHMLSGKSIVVREDMATFISRVIEYRRNLGSFADLG